MAILTIENNVASAMECSEVLGEFSSRKDRENHFLAQVKIVFIQSNPVRAPHFVTTNIGVTAGQPVHLILCLGLFLLINVLKCYMMCEVL
jgi:hypothetical protein